MNKTDYKAAVVHAFGDSVVSVSFDHQLVVVKNALGKKFEVHFSPGYTPLPEELTGEKVTTIAAVRRRLNCGIVTAKGIVETYGLVHNIDAYKPHVMSERWP